jgi:valyl-tRNA synthetase
MVNWDPGLTETALADDEVEYEDEEGAPLAHQVPLRDGSGRFAVVATTRPETMLGDTAVAVNPQRRALQGLDRQGPSTCR